MRQWFNIGCIITCVGVNILPGWLPHIPSSDYGDFFCKMQALSFVIMGIGARSKKNNRYVLIMWDWCVGLAFNNLYDEWWGDPYKLGKIEIVIAVLITLWTLIRLLEWKNQVS